MELISQPHEEHKENPMVAALLGSVGLTAVDLQLFRTLKVECGASILIHGSLMENRFRDKSDIDFTVIGNLDAIPEDIRDTLMPRSLDAAAIANIDYISTSTIGQQGRKLSLHFSNPSFRMGYATSGQATANEYRPAKHAKTGARNYLLPTMSEDNDILLVNFACGSESINNGQGSITTTPQTGRFTIDGELIYAEDNHDTPAMEAANIIKITTNGDVSRGPQKKSVEVVVLGLEFDKMQSDTPLYRDSFTNGEYELYVTNPIRRSMQMVEDYTGINSTVATKSLFEALGKYWSEIKPNKTRRK